MTLLEYGIAGMGRLAPPALGQVVVVAWAAGSCAESLNPRPSVAVRAAARAALAPRRERSRGRARGISMNSHRHEPPGS
jgi:hypothetical protein